MPALGTRACPNSAHLGSTAMPAIILDPELRRRVIRHRRRIGADRHDEVWNGVYIVSPEADNRHQELGLEFSIAVREALGGRIGGKVYQGVNVSDRETDWKKNYRVPDVAVFLPGNPALDRGTHWLGGPDFAVEIRSPYDRSRRKLPFYAKVGVRELLLIDRKPWSLELFRLNEGVLEPVGRSLPETSDWVASAVLPVSFRLVADAPHPRIEVAHRDGIRSWTI